MAAGDVEASVSAANADCACTSSLEVRDSSAPDAASRSSTAFARAVAAGGDRGGDGGGWDKDADEGSVAFISCSSWEAVGCRAAGGQADVASPPSPGATASWTPRFTSLTLTAAAARRSSTDAKTVDLAASWTTPSFSSGQLLLSGEGEETAWLLANGCRFHACHLRVWGKLNKGSLRSTLEMGEPKLPNLPDVWEPSGPLDLTDVASSVADLRCTSVWLAMSETHSSNLTKLSDMPSLFSEKLFGAVDSCFP